MKKFLVNFSILADYNRINREYSFMKVLGLLLNHPGFKFLFCFRILAKSKRFSVLWWISRFFYWRYTYKYGIQIPARVHLGEGFLMPHFGTIVINSNSFIGRNCTILQGVTIGNTKRGKFKGAPTIGDSVYIGPGACVVGAVTIGNNVLIAPNAYVNIDIPSDSIVMGNPAKIIPSSTATVGYL
jgi:serine O-acetyltransferase